MQQTSFSETTDFDLDRKCQWFRVKEKDQKELGFKIQDHENPSTCNLIIENDGIYCQRHKILSEMLDSKGFGN